MLIKENSQNAGLRIYDLQGTEIKSYTITGTGEKTIKLNGNELKAGMYLYSLIIDGVEIDTKRMILTK
jgi:myo-inositol-hexaphosphate 3-phosphohydrolase